MRRLPRLFAVTVLALVSAGLANGAALAAKRHSSTSPAAEPSTPAQQVAPPVETRRAFVVDTATS